MTRPSDSTRNSPRRTATGGASWFDKKEYDKAIADYNEAIRLDPKYAIAVQQPGQRMAREEGIRQGHRRLQRGHPPRSQGFAPAYNNRAWLWATCPEAKQRDGKKSIESATHACELTVWKDSNHIDTLAAAYAEIGDFGKAIEYQEMSIKLNPNFVDRKPGEERLNLYEQKTPYRDLR